MLIFLVLPIFCGFSSSGSFPKPFSFADEKKYLILLKEGNPEEKNFAKHELILHNLRLVAHITKKYHSSQCEQEELLSIGVIGLIKAVLSYDNEKSIRLATYASRCIENEILMFLRLSKKYQNDISLHDPIGTDRDGNEIVMLDVINSNTPDFAEKLDFDIQTEKILKYVLSDLSERERYVIIHRYGLWGHDALTQQEVAKQLTISRSYVSRIEKKALKKLKTTLES